MVCNDVLQRCGNEEILLAETEDLTFHMVVGGVKKLGKRFRVRVLLDRPHILTLCKELHIEVHDILCFPEAEVVDRFAAVTGDHDIVRNRLHLVVIDVCDSEAAVIPFLVDSAAETNGECLIGTGNEPAFGAGDPNIGHFYLVAFDDLLLEKTVFVAKGEACSVVIKSGQGVHEASRKTAETTVTETCIGLGVENVAGVEAQLVDRLPQLGQQIQVVGILHQAAAHEELQ